MRRRLARLIRENVDVLSEKWTDMITDFYPDTPPRDVFRKVRATHLLFVRSLVEGDFGYLFRHLKEEFREWILLKNSWRDMMNLEPIYIMLLKEFITHSRLPETEKKDLVAIVEDLRNSILRDDYNEFYVREQEKLFSRQIDELEVLNLVSGTDLVGNEQPESISAGAAGSAGDPGEMLRITLDRALEVLGATDGVLAFNMDSYHKVVVKFVDAPEQRDRDIVKRITLEDSQEHFDPAVLDAFNKVVDRAVLRNYWNPELIEDLRSQNCPVCPYRDQLVTSVRGNIDCPILQSLKVNTFFCHQLGHEGEKGFMLLSRNITPAFSQEDMTFVETLASGMMTIIKNYQLYRRQVELATTDGLTSLYNHRYFQDALTREISRSARYGAPVTLLYMDIDHFKKFNDTYGHQIGDEVLRLVARTMKRNLRDSDVACRYGGEELVAILPDTPLEGGFAAAEKIRNAIKALSLPVDGKTVKVTISIGIAEYPRNARSKPALIEAADGALYYAKEGGRNQSRLSDADPDRNNIEPPEQTEDILGEEPETSEVDA